MDCLPILIGEGVLGNIFCLFVDRWKDSSMKIHDTKKFVDLS